MLELTIALVLIALNGVFALSELAIVSARKPRLKVMADARRSGARAALALAEAVTRLADRSDPVPDDVYDDAAQHYDPPQLAALILSIAAVNLWNRLNVATPQVPGNGQY